MAATTYSLFGAQTEATEVASAFSGRIKGRTILITGINKGGIGFSTAQAFASQSPHLLILASRSKNKIEECVKILQTEHPEVEYRTVELDLQSQKAVRKAAAEVMSWEDVPKIDLVINNAGIMNIPERTLTEDNIEITFAVNHIGHFLFTNSIMPKVIAAAKNAERGDVRIVNVSSLGMHMEGIRWSDMNFERPSSEIPEEDRPNFGMLKMYGLPHEESLSYVPFGAYGQSKTANALFSISLSSKLLEKYGILGITLHPGEIQTELSRTTDIEWVTAAVQQRAAGNMGGFKSLQAGASTTMVAALDPALTKGESDQTKRYLMDCQLTDNVPPHAASTEQAEKLWKVSEKLVGQEFIL